ncbi:hypothetical protein NEHOM01_2372, partial [Nematocida homosporus]|uniref:uncharacterized protein n=1 Tax=Nematocida homosporus TaxID=1912981 RepID=UPI00222106A5
MNRYSLNVYQVVCLVIGLCCVWCSAVRNSDKMELSARFKRPVLARNSQIVSEYDEITNAIDDLKFVRNTLSTRINQIKQGQQSREETERKAYEGLESTQCSRSFLDELKDIFGPRKIMLLSQLVKIEIQRQSLDIITQQMEQWLEESKNTQMQPGPRIKSICKLANIVQQLKQIKSDAMDPQNQSPNAEISIVENGLIAIGVQCNSHELKSRIKMIMIEELKKIPPKIDTLNWDDITQVIDPVIDQLLKHDEPKSRDNISRIIKETLAQLDGTSKNMEVKSESESE